MDKRFPEKSDLIICGDQRSGAVFDCRRRYRYLLWREWDVQLPAITFVMLNPSTADDINSDPTISRCLGFARRWQFGSLGVANLFAYRATRANALTKVRDPVGAYNDHYIRAAVDLADQVVVAWGNHGLLRERHRHLAALLSSCPQPWCFGITKLAQPKHPLYLRNDAGLVPYRQLLRESDINDS
jgi:hypothetical protein